MTVQRIVISSCITSGSYGP